MCVPSLLGLLFYTFVLIAGALNRSRPISFEAPVVIAVAGFIALTALFITILLPDRVQLDRALHIGVCLGLLLGLVLAGWLTVGVFFTGGGLSGGEALLAAVVAVWNFVRLKLFKIPKENEE